MLSLKTLKLRTYPQDSILITPALPVPEFDVPLLVLNATMIPFAQEHDGVGLAAPQIGIGYRMFVFKYNNIWKSVVNPVIRWRSPEMIEWEEGCLSLPGIYGNVQRSQTIMATYYTPWGRKVNQWFSGMAARIFQHEYDHLDGVLFPQRIHLFKHDSWIKLKPYTRDELWKLDLVKTK